MSLSRHPRRPVYFAFQGLLIAVLILLFVYQSNVQAANWGFRLSLIIISFCSSLVLIQVVSDAMLARGWFQVGMFLGDAAAATIVLSWTHPTSNLFLIYVLILFGTALIRNTRQALVVALVTLALYLIGGWRSYAGFPHSPEFWLRALFLVVSTALLTILARDSAQAQEEGKRRDDERMIQVERLATLGRMAAEVAHRIKGPLTTISVNAEVLAQHHAGDKPTLAELTQIGEEVERCKEILKVLLDLGRIEEMDREPLDLRLSVERASRRMRPQVKERGAHLTIKVPDASMPARGDESLIQEALCALLQNAVEAVSRGGHIRVEADTLGGRHLVSVIDDGAGVAGPDQEKIFEPFFTTKKEGSGLGLSSALRIAQKHGGTIEVESGGAGLGCRFTFILPSAR